MALSTLAFSLALASVASTATAAGFTAHQDSLCQIPLEIKQDGESIPNNELVAKHSITAWSYAGGTYYQDLEVINGTTVSPIKCILLQRVN